VAEVLADGDQVGELLRGQGGDVVTCGVCRLLIHRAVNLDAQVCCLVESEAVDDREEKVVGCDRELVWNTACSETCSAFGPIGIRPMEMRTISRWRRIIARPARATSLSCSCQRWGSGAGISTSGFVIARTAFRDSQDVATIAELLGRIGEGVAQIDEATRRVTVRVDAAGDGPLTALQSLHATGVELDDIAMRQPNLDEVFLTLTGQRSDDDHDAAPARAA
jgi:hypothetical protein